MGGKEGGRGYLYQGIVAVLEALERPDWDRIYVEFPTEGDKVDIALRSAGEITDAIQVKSTANSFEKGDLSKWLSDIIADYPCQRYHLILIGNCAASAVGFINAVHKFQTGKLDAGAKKQLDGFETKSLVGIQINFKVLPFDPDSLKSLTREAFWKYTYEAGHSLDPPHATLLVDAMIEEQLLQSTKDGYTDRAIFKQELDDRIKMLIKRPIKGRKEIEIVAFSRGTEHILKNAQSLLDLRDKFDKRFLKPDLNWTTETRRSTAERKACLHIFASVPNAFMFYLGQVSRSFGRCILYEYDFELHDTCSYTPSIHFGGKGGLE